MTDFLGDNGWRCSNVRSRETAQYFEKNFVGLFGFVFTVST